jgi:hypothetical protein
LFFAGALLFQLASPVFAEEAAFRQYKLPGHGFLEALVPLSWQDEVREPPLLGLPPTIVLHPNQSGEVLVMITPLWNIGSVRDFNSDKAVKEAINAEKDQLAAGASEEELILEKIEGPKASGYYFIATDKAPKPSQWKFTVRAAMATGELLVTVTVLGHDKEAAELEDALALIRNLRQRR